MYSVYIYGGSCGLRWVGVCSISGITCIWMFCPLQGVVCTLHEGDDFGKLALVNDAPRAASIVLREDNCHFLRVDKEDFNRILRVSSRQSVAERHPIFSFCQISRFECQVNWAILWLLNALGTKNLGHKSGTFDVLVCILGSWGIFQ